MTVRTSKAALAGLVIVVLAIGSIATITYMTGGLDWLILGGVSPDKPLPIEGVDEAWVLSTFDFALVKEDAVATKVEAADAFIWFDWNQDGAMQRAPFEGITDEGLINGEIEELASAATTGLVTSGHEYPIGEYFYIQYHKTGYQSNTIKRAMFGIRNADGTAKSLGNIAMRATDTAATDSITATGAGVLVTATGDYNYTTYGTAPRLSFQHAAATTDSGFSSQTHPDFDSGITWTHWGTGKIYASTYVGMIMTNQDAIDLDPDMAGYWDERIVGASNTYFLKYVSDSEAGLFYKDTDDGPAIYEFNFYFDIHADGDIISIGVYQDVEMEDAMIGQWGSLYLGTYETNLDFVV